MLGTMIQNIFVKFYTMMKLNLFLWAYSICGLVIFGIGPAVLTVTTLFQEYGWDYQQISFKEGFSLFKENFKTGNAYGWLFGSIGFILIYNLYLSVQIQGLLFLVIDFILFFATLLTFSVYMVVQLIKSVYDISFWNSIKLALVWFFSNFLAVLKYYLGVIVIGYITYKALGLLLFATFAAVIIWTSVSCKTWLLSVDQKLDEGTDVSMINSK